MSAIQDLGINEVVGVSRIEGPLVIVEGTGKVGYDEVVEIIDSQGQLRYGRVLEVGRTVSAAATTAELYDPTSGKFSSGGTTNRVLDCDTATLLADGSVLLVGGATNGPNGTQPLATAVLYRP